MDYREHAAALGLENSEFLELAELFLDTCAADLEKLERALASRDARGAERAAHSMKGASGNLGLEELSTIARAIELATAQGSLTGIERRIEEFKQRLEMLSRELREG